MESDNSIEAIIDEPHISEEYLKYNPQKGQEKILSEIRQIQNKDIKQSLYVPLVIGYDILNQQKEFSSKLNDEIIKLQKVVLSNENQQDFDKYLNQMAKFSQMIEHISRIVLSVENKNPIEHLQKINQEYSFLKDTQIHMDHPDELNIKILLDVNEDLVQILLNYQKLWKKGNDVGHQMSQDEFEMLFEDLQITSSKIDTFMETYPFAVKLSKDSLFSQPRDGQIWQELLKAVQYVHYDTPDKVRKQIDNFMEIVTLGNSIVYKQKRQKNSFIWSSLYYLVNKNQTERCTKLFLAKANAEEAFHLWNMLETGLIKQCMQLGLPNIEFMENIYVPKIYPEITLEGQKEQIRNNTINKINEKKLDPMQVGYDSTIFYEPNRADASNSRVQIRILNHKKLKKLSKYQIAKSDFSLSSSVDLTHEKSFNQNQQPQPQEQQQQHIKKMTYSQILRDKISTTIFGSNQVYDKVIVHVHGGGFVSMSSNSHQSYTRQWANKLEVPLLSIDYGLAPKHPYPEALNDIWQAYNWIINNIHQYYNINPKNIILVGDSAGGNLILALMGLIVKYGVQKPIGVVPMYPVANMDLSIYHPSHLKSLDDILLSHNLLKLCQKAYLKDEEGKYRISPYEDPFISPMLFSQEILSEFPPVRIASGNEDPLRDDAFQLVKNLQQAKIDVKLTVFYSFPHGFLSFYPYMGIQETGQIIQELMKQKA